MKKPSGKSKKKHLKMHGDKAKQHLGKFARGGATKKPHKTQVNIMVGHGGQAAPVPPIAPPGGPPAPMGAPPAPPGAAAPPGMGMRPPGMKRGGKVPKMTAGALSGEGRLQKTAIQKRKR